MAETGIITTEQFLGAKLKRFTAIWENESKATRSMAMAANLINGNASLLECLQTVQGQNSVMQCLMDVAAFKLYPSPSLGHVYLIPYKGICTLQFGYKGLIALGKRDPSVITFGADVVHEGDEYQYEEGTNGRISLRKSFVRGRDERPVLFAYSTISFVGGVTDVKVLTLEQIEKVRNSSNAWKSGKPKAMAFWRDFFDQMAIKTNIRAHSKTLSIGDDFMHAVAKDTEGIVQYDNLIGRQPILEEKTHNIEEGIDE